MTEIDKVFDEERCGVMLSVAYWLEWLHRAVLRLKVQDKETKRTKF